MPIQNYFGIIVVIVSALFGVWGLFHVWKLNARRAASTKFRAAVLNAFKDLYPLPADWPEGGLGGGGIHRRLESVFSDLQIAIAEFRPFIPWYRRWAFDRAWSRYRNAYGREIDYQCYHHYMAFGSNPDPRGEFRRNVDRLLSFAKYH